MSTSHHPQTDGASEVMNCMLENYLRCYCSYRQNDWDALLPAAEFAYNSAVSEGLGMSPFELDLAWNPGSPVEGVWNADTPIQSVNDLKSRLKKALEDAQFSHEVAKARHSAYTARKYIPARYKVGDRVWINRTLFRDAVSQSQESDKLSSKRCGPFSITQLIGKNAVRLDLPANIRIHPVVHVAHTTPFLEQPLDIQRPVPTCPDPVPDTSGALLFEVDKIVKHRKRGRCYQWLTLLKGSPQHEAEWQPTRDFVHDDGTLTTSFREYLVEHNLLPHLVEASK